MPPVNNRAERREKLKTKNLNIPPYPPPIYVTEIHCQNQYCNVLPSTIVTRDYNPDRTSFFCPVCGKPAKVNWRLTAKDWREQELVRIALGNLPESMLAPVEND
jgi:hypothetical protein